MATTYILKLKFLQRDRTMLTTTPIDQQEYETIL